MANNKKVLLVGNFLSEAIGARAVCEELAERLSMRNWLVITASNKVGRVARLWDMVHTIWSNRRNFAVALVEVYSGPAFFWAEVVCQTLTLIRKPFILVLHGGNLPAFAHRWPMRVKRLLRSARFVSTPSNYLQNHMQVFRKDLCLIPNPLDLQSYHFRLRSQPQPLLVWLRAFRDIYNPTLAPQVISRLALEFANVHLSMIGPDKGDGSLHKTKKLAKKLNVFDLITFTGRVPKREVPFWLRRADIFLNTTNFDNMPVSVMEAMASGLCIISTDVGGLPDLITHDQDGLLVPPNDPQAMAAAVRRLLTEPDLAARLSRQARQKAEQYDWSVIMPQWETLLGAVIEGSQC